ncbi:MAG: hypothetical protein JO214_14065 [Frankiaceae bacterium]|nr:hypothetical protein [Frankiaceae bacterium]
MTDQLQPTPDYAPDPSEQSPPPSLSKEERERLTAQVRGTALPTEGVEGGPDGQLAKARAELTETERRADHDAAQSRVDAGLPPRDGDDEKLAAFIEDAATDDEPEKPEPIEGTVIKADEIVTPEPVEEPEPTGTAVALVEKFDVTTTGEVWPYEFLEFKGDKLGIRLPTRQALAAFSLSSSKYVSLGVKNDLTGLFIARHLSPESYGRVFSRLMDPDEDDYDVDTVGELFNAIVTAAVDADKAAEAAKKQADGQG